MVTFPGGTSFRCAPYLPAANQSAVWFAYPLIQLFYCGYPVCTKMTEVLSQFAPSDQHARGIRIAKNHRPYRTLGWLTPLIAIMQVQFHFFAYCRSKDRRVHRIRGLIQRQLRRSARRNNE